MIDNLRTKLFIEIECYDQIPGTVFSGTIDNVELYKDDPLNRYRIYTATVIRCQHEHEVFITEFSHLRNNGYLLYSKDTEMLENHIDQMLYYHNRNIYGDSIPFNLVDGLENTVDLDKLDHIDFIGFGFYISGEYARVNSSDVTVTFITVYSSKEKAEHIIQVLNYIPGKDLTLMTPSEKDMIKILSTFSYTLNFN